jgi:hypothetical protein
VGEYHVPIQFDKDLRTDITLKVEADRALEEAQEEIEIDEEGEMVQKKPERGERKPRRGEAEAEAPIAQEDRPADAKEVAPRAAKATKKDKIVKA